MPFTGKGMCFSYCSLLPLCWDAHVIMKQPFYPEVEGAYEGKQSCHWMWTIAL